MKIRNWDVFVFVVAYHALALALIPVVIAHLSWTAVGIFLLTFIVGGLSITAGYHRLYAHRTFQAHPVFEWAVLLGSTLAFQWSALSWSHDHRLHHNHVDTEEDPYSIRKGFWYAHMLWLFSYRQQFQPKLVDDLMKNRRVMFQHRYFLPLAILTNLIVFGIACLFLTPLAALAFAVVFRLLALHHCTWFINSLAHTIGSKTYARELSAVDNAFLALVTFGEGYHNYHHAFANDYRNGVRWYHFDPTKWVIWIGSKLGITGGLRTVNEIRIQKSLVQKDRSLILDWLRDEADELAVEIREKLDELANTFDETASILAERMRDIRKAGTEKRRLLRLEIRRLRAALRELWREWIALTSYVCKRYRIAHSH